LYPVVRYGRSPEIIEVFPTSGERCPKLRLGKLTANHMLFAAYLVKLVVAFQKLSGHFATSLSLDTF
jgi:hypothetical protein